MVIIVAGSLTIKSGARDEFIVRSCESILMARAHEDCLDFSVSPDPLELTRVNVFEKWKSQESLVRFRNSGSENDLFSLVESFDVTEYEIN